MGKFCYRCSVVSYAVRSAISTTAGLLFLRYFVNRPRRDTMGHSIWWLRRNVKRVPCFRCKTAGWAITASCIQK